MTGTLVHECPTLESEENAEDQRDVSEGPVRSASLHQVEAGEKVVPGLLITLL